jgi:hypothetical protein
MPMSNQRFIQISKNWRQDVDRSTTAKEFAQARNTAKNAIVKALKTAPTLTEDEAIELAELIEDVL